MTTHETALRAMPSDHELTPDEAQQVRTLLHRQVDTLTPRELGSQARNPTRDLVRHALMGELQVLRAVQVAELACAEWLAAQRDEAARAVYVERRREILRWIDEAIALRQIPQRPATVVCIDDCGHQDVG